jgi:signal-transduction protein with cAMP-binding, CBS, and nucleotidyltransferase domain
MHPEPGGLDRTGTPAERWATGNLGGPGMEAREFLGSVPFFAEVLSGAELDSLAAAARPVRFDRGAQLIAERDLGDSMFLITEGTVTVSVRNSGKDREVATLQAGELIGEMSLLTGAPRAATVTARAAVAALEIDKAAIAPLLRAEPALFDRFAAMLEKRQRELDKVYGQGLWFFYGPPRANLAAVIRTYFADLPK